MFYILLNLPVPQNLPMLLILILYTYNFIFTPLPSACIGNPTINIITVLDILHLPQSNPLDMFS
jgi:hypothetical protein